MDMFVKTVIFMAVPLSDVLHFPNCHQAGDAFSGYADGGQMEWSRLSAGWRYMKFMMMGCCVTKPIIHT